MDTEISTDTKPAPPVAKLLKDVLERYLKAQCELSDLFFDIFQRIEKISQDLEDNTKRKRQ